MVTLHAVVVQHVGELDADRAGTRDDDARGQRVGEDLLLVGHHAIAERLVPGSSRAFAPVAMIAWSNVSSVMLPSSV